MEIVNCFLSAYLELSRLTAVVVVDLNSSWHYQLYIVVYVGHNGQSERRRELFFKNFADILHFFFSIFVPSDNLYYIKVTFS